MITPPEPVDPHDAAASAVVDGVATPEERALLDASPVGAHRVLAHRHVAAAVGAEPAPQDDTAADAAVATALGAFGTDEAVAPVVAIRSGRPKAVRWLAPAAAAAAALLLVVGVTGALRSGEETTTSGSEAALRAPASIADDPAAQGAGVAPVEGTASAPLDGGDVGTIRDPAELAQRISEALDGAGSNANTVRAGAQRSDVAGCTAKAPTVSPVPVTSLRYTAVGTYEGAKVVVLAYGRSDGPARILLLLDIKTCDLLTDQDF